MATKPPEERKASVTCTLLPENVAFLDEQVATRRFGNRSVAIDYAIYLFAKSENETKNKDPQEVYDELMAWIDRLQDRTELLSTNLELAQARIEALETEAARA